MGKSPDSAKILFSPKKHSTLWGWLPGVTRIPYGPGASSVTECCEWFQPAQEGPSGLPWPPQDTSVFSSQIKAQEPCPAFFSLPRTQGLVQGACPTFRDLQRLFPGETICFPGPERARKPQNCSGLYQPPQVLGRALSFGCPGNSLKVPRTLDPWEGLKKCFPLDFLWYVFSRGHLFCLFCEHVLILWKVPTGCVAILDFKMEVCLHPVHHIGILFSYYFTIFMSTCYWEFQ